METVQLLEKVVDDGIEAAKRDYAKDKVKLKGAVAGFEACRNRTLDELKRLLDTSSRRTRDARLNNAENYWEIRAYEAEVEWVCNVVSYVLYLTDQPVIVQPTARGAQKAAQLLGIANTFPVHVKPAQQGRKL